MSEQATDDTDDEFEQERRDRVARVAGNNVRHAQADRPGKSAADAVQQESCECRECISEMERSTGAENIRDPEKLIGDKAERRHDAGDHDLLCGESFFLNRFFCEASCGGDTGVSHDVTFFREL